jgi:prepilin-type N-terminal cleavage/methylation domain-containing protein
MQSLRYPYFLRAARGGFSLIELLSVLVVISIVSALVVTAMNSLGKADGFNNATTTLSTLLEQARAYAMANNTYVFVGIEETDASQSAGGPQNPGTGRVGVQAFASQDGTLNLAASNLTAINRLQILNNLHVPATLTATSGTLANRPTADYSLGSSTGSTSFPSVTSANAITARNFTFSKVIAFDALGIVHIPTSPAISGFQYIEIDAEPTNGTIIPTNTTNVSAIQVDATTGAITVFRS